MPLRTLTAMLFLCSFVFHPNARLEAQYGVSSASVGMGRAGIRMSADQIRLEEFINYHKHDLPRPTDDQRVELDLRWDWLKKDRAVLQVGIATPTECNLHEAMRPLNLVLVIDCSGSMAGDRIDNVKKGILAFVEQFRPDDHVAIVAYNSTASVVLESCKKADIARIQKAVQSLKADKTTNLHAGLMLGYKLATRHYDQERTNRVILLTDGIANTGVVDAQQIARESKTFNDEGIDLSTIGLGHDLNQDLLRTLADAGRGLIHFIGDDQDIEKTFIHEIESLLSPAARDVRLTIQVEGADGEALIIGYRPKKKGDRWVIELDDLNHGATQVVLSEFDVAGRDVRAVATLKYTDALTGQSVKLTRKVNGSAKGSERALLADQDVRKNTAIAKLAQGIQQFVQFEESEKSEKAEQTLRQKIQFARMWFPAEQDADVDRMVAICQQMLGDQE